MLIAPPPSSGAARHLLPPGEKGSGRHDLSGFPSPSMGEGARRADEGGASRANPPTTSRARALRWRPTPQEMTLWRLLRDRRLSGFKFRRQVPIGPYVADFACYEGKLVVELDGSQHVENAGDVRRDAELQRRGFRVLRIWNNALTFERDGVLEAIWAALQVESPPPSSGAARHLLPPGEKERRGHDQATSPTSRAGKGDQKV